MARAVMAAGDEGVGILHRQLPAGQVGAQMHLADLESKAQPEEVCQKGIKAIAALPRNLWGVVGPVVTNKAPNRHADVAMVARKLQRWGKSHQLTHRHGLSRGACARQHLQRLPLAPSDEGKAQREQNSAMLPALAA